jgi:hypothetical protein
VVGTKLCVPCLLEVKGKGIRGVANKEAYTVHTINIISQQQYFVACHLSLYVGKVFVLYSVCKLVTGEMHDLVPTTVQSNNYLGKIKTNNSDSIIMITEELQ